MTTPRAEAEAAYLAAFTKMRTAHAALMRDVHSVELAVAHHVAAIEARRCFDEMTNVDYREAREARGGK